MGSIQYYGTGKRKSSVARVFLRPGDGNISVNERELDDYFERLRRVKQVLLPLRVTETENKFDIEINIEGGGKTGQAEAIRHGISKALLEYNEELREELKVRGLLTRDARVKERKKYGRKGARAKYQHSKR